MRDAALLRPVSANVLLIGGRRRSRCYGSRLGPDWQLTPCGVAATPPARRILIAAGSFRRLPSDPANASRLPHPGFRG